MPGKKILLTTIGSLGDLHPYVALAIELKARGHRPVVATHEMYREKVEREGIEFAAVRPNLEDLGDEQVLMKKIMHPIHGTRHVVKDVVLRYVRETYVDLLEACRGADLIVAHALTYNAPIVAEQLGIRWIGTALQPMIFLSAYDPPILGPIAWLSRRRWGPKFHGRLLRFATNSLRSWAKPLDRIRREAGLPPAATHPLFAGMFSPLLNLVLFSRHLAAPQPDWPAHCVMCGFPFYDKGMNVEHGSLSPQLEAFLQSGEPPVVFTLGSSAVAAAGNFYRESFLAAKKFDIRSVLLIGRDERNRPTEPIPDHICVDDYAPYSLLFPRAGAVVHQGGVGTTGQVLRAGKPQIIVPFAHDQPDNAHRITELGCGLWLPRRKLQTDRLGAMLVQLREPRFRNKAAEIGAAVTAEDGCAAACDEIDRLFNT